MSNPISEFFDRDVQTDGPRVIFTFGSHGEAIGALNAARASIQSGSRIVRICPVCDIADCAEHRDAANTSRPRREAARLLLDMLHMRNGAHEGVTRDDAQRMWEAASTREGYGAVDAFLRSIIGEGCI